MKTTLLAAGEAMIEMSAGTDGQWRMGFAGDTFNTAWYARALLPENRRVAYFTALGTDRYSEALRRFLSGAGLDISLIATVPDRRPGLYFIHHEAGDRHFTYWRDRSAARLLAEDEALLDTAFSSTEAIYISGITLAILAPEARARLMAALSRARATGVRICFDPNIRPSLWSTADEARSALTEAARLSDIVLPTFGDEQALFGDADPHATAARYAGLGATEIVVKNGGMPALLREGDAETEVPAIRAGHVVDATGAGDSFNGAYLAARLTGSRGYEAAVAAHRIAAICIGHHGALAPRDTLF